MTKLSQVWDLESIFQGGSDSASFKTYLEKFSEETELLNQKLESLLKEADPSEAAFVDVITLMQSLMIKSREAGAFTSCLTAQNTKDELAILLSNKVLSLSTRFRNVVTLFDELLLKLEDSTLQGWLQQPKLSAIQFHLNEKKERAKDKLSTAEESLAQDLAVDGYHGWSKLYDTIVRRLEFPFEADGQTVMLSAGQAQNKLSDKDRSVRETMFKTWEQVWGSYADLFSDTLNRLAGFRLQLYKHRGWESVLKEPTEINRMQEKTLQVIWETINRNQPVFVKYLERKAKLMGLDALSWHDVDAPLGEVSMHYTFDEAAEFIIEQFGKFSNHMADFAREAFDKAWIEAEDRPGKRPGGFCTSLPDSKQTRIFMTFDGSPGTVSTLAHELGHAYHQRVMEQLPAFAQQYAMNVAETASTLAEMIVSDASVKAAASTDAKVALLDDKLQRAIAFFMNIQARFLFETRFYEERKQGVVPTKRINELMLEAQKEAYQHSLSEYHPHFWASKLHFYISGVPFYNYPYTFGYLFSAGIYAYAEKTGGSFEERYMELLKDTASMKVEDLASKHLGADLTAPAFWQDAIDLTIRDIEEFLALTEAQV